MEPSEPPSDNRANELPKNPVTLADELKRARAQRGLDPAHVAGTAGVAEEDLRRLEAGVDDLKLASGVKISRALWGQIEFVHDSIRADYSGPLARGYQRGSVVRPGLRPALTLTTFGRPAATC